MAQTSDRAAQPSDGGAKSFFEGYAADFDHIYDDTGKSAFARFVDTQLRKEMRIRFENTFEALQPMAGKSLLDAGCGGGRYAIPAAKAGASSILGLDFSEPMLELARQKAKAEGVGNVCRFENGDLLTYPIPEKSFDYAIAIGFFDYMQDPEAALRALVRATRQRVFFSVPKRWHILTPQRYVRYWYLRKCYIRFYSHADVERITASVKPRAVRIQDIGREFNITVDV